MLKIQVKILFILFFLLVQKTSLFSQSHQDLKIGILSGTKTSSLKFVGVSGKYDVISGGSKIISADPSIRLELSINPMGIELKYQERVMGVYNDVQIVGVDTGNSLKIKTSGSNRMMAYDGNFKISKQGNFFKMINMVNLEDYVTTVMESEAGNSSLMEYLKLQAILCRTFTHKNAGKHLADGFDLCDKVHCQVYGEKKRTNPLILQAVKITKGKVVVDKNNQIILSAYHSNCGGQTINSEDVWNTPLPYLRSVKDSFCQSQPHAYWKEKIPVKAWDSRYAEHDQKQIQDTFNQVCYNYTPKSRECIVPYKGKNLQLKNVRTDWGLRSTDFAINEKKDTLFLTGRGFGHGVGLCQEGAMKMVTRGYKYEQILRYYYKNVSIAFVDSIFN